MRPITAFMTLFSLPGLAAASTVYTVECDPVAIADGLSAATSGDEVHVEAGSCVVCDLDVPAGVLLSGDGPATVLQGASCVTALMSIADGGSLSSLRIEPDDSGVGVEFAGSAMLERVEVRGGDPILSGVGAGGGSIALASTLLVAGAQTSIGIEAGAAAWTLQQVTLARPVNTAGLGTGVSGIGGSFDATESIFSQWSTAVDPGAGLCSVGLSAVVPPLTPSLSDALGTCVQPSLIPNLHADPLFVSPVDHLGDFHLQSVGGQWNGVDAFVPGPLTSPYVDLGTPDAGRADSQDDPLWPCGLPNLGGYGGTPDASRSAATECPVTNLMTGGEYRSLAAAVAAGGDAGDELRVRAGQLLELETVVLDWSPQIVGSASGSDIVAAFGPDPVVFEVENGLTDAVEIRGVDVFAGTSGTGTSILLGDADTNVLVQDAVLLGERGVDAVGGEFSRALVLQDAAIGSEDLHAEQAIYFAPEGSAADISNSTAVTVEDSVVWADQQCIYLNLNPDAGLRVVTVERSVLRCGTAGIADDAGGTLATGAESISVILRASVLLTGGAGVHLTDGHNGARSIVATNNLLISTAGSSLLYQYKSVGLPYEIINNTMVGGEFAVSVYAWIGYDPPAGEITNNIIVDTSGDAISHSDPFVGVDDPNYNLFWNIGGVLSTVPLGTDNVTNCNPGLPPVPSYPFDPSFDPTLYALPEPCAIGVGHPDSQYLAGLGGSNDIGAQGGPEGDDFLALFDADGDGFIVGPDCDDTDDTVHPDALDICGDGVDSDCSGGDAPDADGDGFEDGGCLTATLPADCDDTDDAVYPGAPEVACDGLQQDCNLPLTLDVDGDGFDGCGGPDCNDLDASIFPGATELCDGIDNDCDPTTEVFGE